MKNDNTHKGMKFTEVGWIPEDWKVKQIKEEFSLIRNGVGYNTKNKMGYPMCRIETMSKGYIDYNLVGFSSVEPINYKMERGDFLFSHINSLPYIGKIAYYNAEQPLYHGMNVLLFRAKEKKSCKFLFYLFSAYNQKVRFESIAKPAINQASISIKDLIELKIPLPSLLEQMRIASVLSDMDSLISSLSSTIEKKRLIKKGTMQQLLSGKTRLKGYTEEWVEDSLGEHGKFCGHAITPNSMPNELFVEYSMPAFDEGKKPTLTMGKEMLSARTAIEGELLLINKLNVRQKRIWYIKQCEENAVCSGEFLPYKSNDIYLPFLQQLLLTDSVIEDFMELSTGTSNSQKRVTPKQILNYIIKFPKDWNEQFAIAEILRTMDDEILALEKELEKFKVLKQGMMQKLLTGQIRLKYKDIAYN